MKIIEVDHFINTVKMIDLLIWQQHRLNLFYFFGRFFHFSGFNDNSYNKTEIHQVISVPRNIDSIDR